MKNSTGSMALVETLKKNLKAKGINYKTLGQEWGLSESSVKRLMSQGDLTLERIEQACHAMQMTFADLVKLSPLETEGIDPTLLPDQEAAFVANPALFHFFSLLEEGKTAKQIERKYDISPAEIQKFLLILDRVQLIELLPQNKVRLKVVNKIRFRRDGPMGKLILDQAKSSFLDSEFKAETEHLRFGLYRLNPQSAHRYKSKMDKLLHEMKADSDYEQNQADAVDFGFLLALRPWHSTLLRALKLRSK